MIGNTEIHVALKAATKAAWHAGHGRLDHDDCVSEANEAVALAMRTFDPSKGASLSTYAANRARWQAKKLLRTGWRNIPMPLEWFDAFPTASPAELDELFNGIELHVVTLWLFHGYTYRQIAEQMGLTCFRVFEIMKRVKKRLLNGTGGS